MKPMQHREAIALVYFVSSIIQVAYLLLNMTVIYVTITTKILIIRCSTSKQWHWGLVAVTGRGNKMSFSWTKTTTTTTNTGNLRTTFFSVRRLSDTRSWLGVKNTRITFRRGNISIDCQGNLLYLYVVTVFVIHRFVWRWFMCDLIANISLMDLCY